MSGDWLWIGLVFTVFIALIVYEYLDHDCLPHKECYHRVPSPGENTPTNEVFLSLHDMLRSNINIVTWRQALLAALAASVFVVVFLYGRFPTPYEVFFIGFLVFIGVYFSLSWMWAHFYSPNALQVEKGLSLLEERILSDKKKNKKAK